MITPPPAYTCRETTDRTCDGCGKTLFKGERVLDTLLGSRHVGCSSPQHFAVAICPDCGEAHPGPIDGGCLL